MDCCLWLNRKKISNAAEIIDNFDLAAVRGYFLGGSLSEWLREHGGTVYADRLDKLRTLDPQDPQLNDRLVEVFGVSAGAVTEVFCGNAPDNGMSRCGSFGSFSGGFRGSSGSFNFGSYGVFQVPAWESVQADTQALEHGSVPADLPRLGATDSASGNGSGNGASLGVGRSGARLVL